MENEKMLRLIGKTLEGELIEFDVDEIGNVFPSDGVLYVDHVPVDVETIEPIKEMPKGMVAIGDQYKATLDEVRAIWMAVSEDPRISMRCLAGRFYMGTTKVNHILKFLERAGYIQPVHHRHCCRSVSIQFVHM